jgi:lambda family phage portal protein
MSESLLISSLPQSCAVVIDGAQAPRAKAGPRMPLSVRRGQVTARFDAAQSTPEMRRHWANADQLSPNAATNPAVRAIIRSHSRYEYENNGYAKGVVSTLTNFVIGTGPRLQVQTDNRDVNREIERKFARWCRAIGFARKLRLAFRTRTVAGDGIGALLTNPRVRSKVKLDLRIVEPEQVTTPITRWRPDDDSMVDGIEFDRWGNPARYFVLRRHPGDGGSIDSRSGTYDVLPADSVVHLFHEDRPGQRRGIPLLTPSLTLYAMLRRYTLAVLGTAEQAALPGGVIYSDAGADIGEEDEPEPMDEIELERNMWVTLPRTWKLGQVKAEQPTDTYGGFKREIVAESGRAMDMPRNLAASDSSDYNYASGRLDHQAFRKAVDVDHQDIEEAACDPIFEAWAREAVLISGYLSLPVRTALADIDESPDHEWIWDAGEHVDPQKEAKAQTERLKNHTTTLRREWARQGRDWEEEVEQIGRERALLKELGISAATPTTPTGGENADDDQDESDDEREESREDEDARGGDGERDDE